MVRALRGTVCFVAQVTVENNDRRLQRCYNEIFLPAFADVGLTIDALSVECNEWSDLIPRISAADVCFADITDDHPMLWMVIGCAISLNKPLCLVAAQSAELFAAPVPLPVSSKTIAYPRFLTESDHFALRRKLMDSLGSILALPLYHSTSAAGPNSFDCRSEPKPLTEAVRGQSPCVPAKVEPVPQELTTALSLSPHEILALTLIAHEATTEGIRVRRLAQNMNKFGLVRATSLAVNSLRRKHCVIRYVSPPVEGSAMAETERLSITPTGLNWLEHHSFSIERAVSLIVSAAEPCNPIDLVTSRSDNN